MAPSFYEEMMEHPMSGTGLVAFIEDFAGYVMRIRECGERLAGWVALLAGGVKAVRQ